MIEKRLLKVEQQTGNKIHGRAIVFNSPSKKMGGVDGFKEVILPSALDNADMSNLVLLVNHDENMVLARYGDKLSIEIDPVGLFFDASIPKGLSYSDDLLVQLEEGLITQCSFSFTVAKEYWEGNTRYIEEIDQLLDISVVTTPAYAETVFQKRSMNDETKKRIATYESK